jgi:prepilin-type N-terminal cleavage/methylation domain-containing protein
MKKLQKGFTLIELLVVIAIIGILSSIVLASLSSARSKGTDAAITSTLSNMRAQAELLYSNVGSYGVANVATTCTPATNDIFGTSTVGSLKSLTTDLISKASGSSNVLCNSSPTAWVAAAKLTSSGGGYACVDSTGVSKVTPGATALIGAVGTGAVLSATADACN